MMNPTRMALCLLLLASTACDNSGDFESECTLTCSLADGGVVQNQQRVACCGVHDNPSHPNEEGSACTVDWVLSHTQQLCDARTLWTTGPDGGSGPYACPASAFHCNCAAPHTYPSYRGCD